MNKKRTIKDDFTTLALLLIPIAVAVNIVGGQIAGTLKLPLYLDSIGIIVGAMLCGPWVGAVIGLLTNLILGIANPVLLPYAIVSVTGGLLTGFLALKDMFSTKLKCVISTLLITIVAVLVCAPITVIVFGGVTGNGTSLITGTFVAAGQDIWATVFGVEGVFALADRVIAMIVIAAVIKVIPDRTLIKFPCGEKYIKN